MVTREHPSTTVDQFSGSPRAGSARRRTAFWTIGFRPCYLGAAIFGCLAMVTWLFAISGSSRAAAHLPGPMWHAHEMLFGVVSPVITGFLFTAVRNWTGRPTPRGIVLAGIVALWALGRGFVWVGWLGPAAACDTAFAVASALAIAVPLARSGNRRNYLFIALLLILGAANLAFHAAVHGMFALDPRQFLQIALDVVLFIVAVVGGRVIPLFTGNAISGATPRRVPWVERTSLGSIVALIAVDTVAAAPPVLIAVSAFAAAAHAIRWALWKPVSSRGKAIVWILHAAYAWVPVHLALRALAAAGITTTSVASHALTVGVIGGLTLGMMTRTARGHTGRALAAGRTETLIYGLVLVAAVLRVFVPLVSAEATMPAILVSGTLWALAFGLYAARFAPVLVLQRADGRED